MNFKLTKVLIDSIEFSILEENKDKLLFICKDLLAPDIAEILKSLDFEKAQYLFNLIDEELGADILIELEEDLREKLLFKLSSKEIVDDVIDNLESDDAADVIQELPAHKQKEVLSNITDPKQASDIADLLSYDENSAGALMAKELIKVHEEWSVLRCVSEMRKQAQDVNQVYTIYVINKASNKGSIDKHLYKNWSDLEKKEFENIINEIFPNYDEIKTNP